MIRDKINQRSSWGYKAREKFKSFDIFGQKPRLTWRGEETYKTLWGATVSTVITLLLTAYFIYRLLYLALRMDPTLSMTALRLADDEDTLYKRFILTLDKTENFNS